MVVSIESLSGGNFYVLQSAIQLPASDSPDPCLLRWIEMYRSACAAACDLAQLICADKDHIPPGIVIEYTVQRKDLLEN